ncbi:putative RNA-directed DNA polymerase from transposon BS [Amphibalanus amphitrite]|uniref:Putative RNA-directed DNA polymerase from transposon BS n=1 Tax=Amphibalanus amphitrite TaxID=1232801 RepID=A0A6A4VN60_AMPAM|nr:putative RNA-directed DNA polymerase from transposon BS [Amphibalanus amphitrite]KAF0309113.1 putative RNA-directed DNA polymerase from transposon BS [Amphibalanus amphitrite]
MGDVNAHSDSWDHHQRPSHLGLQIEEWTTDSGLLILNDGSHTRVNPATGGLSTPDITLATADVGATAEWSTQPNLGSDHLPIRTTLTADLPPTRRGRGKFSFRKADWTGFRESLEKKMSEINVDTPINQLNQQITKAITSSARKHIPFGNGRSAKGPFWSDKCEEAVKARDAALRTATQPSRTRADMEAYQQARAEADKVITAEKRAHLDETLKNLRPDADLWRIIRNLDGRRTPKPKESIQREQRGPTPPSGPAVTDKQKANLFIKEYAAGLAQGSVLAPLLWNIYASDILPRAPPGVHISVYADDVALWATERKLSQCEATLQPALDEISDWCTRWKVQLSASKCSATPFSLDPREAGGKVHLKLSLQNRPVNHVTYPTFLGLKMDGGLTFSEHIKQLKKSMARRRNCLAALAGRSYGCSRRTLRAAYIGYIRSLADYGAAVYMTHAAPASRQALEAEQNACARIITGCIRPTRRDALLAEAQLEPLTVRAKKLSSNEAQRLKRLPPDDPAKEVIDREVPPRLKYRAHEAWIREVQQAGTNSGPPLPCDEDVVLDAKPCVRRVAAWMASEAGLAELPAEPLALTPPVLLPDSTSLTTSTSLTVPTSRTDPPEARRAAAETTLASLPQPDVSIWTDGSAGGGTHDGGGGALLIFHQESRTVQLTVAAGKVCSSTRAELVAIREALAEAAGDLPDRPGLLLLCCDSRAAIQSLQDTADSQSALVAEIRDLLDTITRSGHRLHLQWVPGHAGLPENEEADRLAAIGSSRRQDQIPVDLWSARAAVARRARAMCDARARRSHPHPDPTPGHDGLDRRASVTVAQLRVGCSPLTGDTRHRLGLAESDACVDCGEPDSVPHLLMDCPAHQGPRTRRWGPLPTLGEIFSTEADLIVDFLVETGRAPRDPA